MSKIAISLISLALAAALVFLLIIPFWSSIMALKQELVSKKEEALKIEELLAKTQQLKQDYEEVSTDAEKIFLSLPSEEDVPYLLVQFDTLAMSNGLLFESIGFGDLAEEEKGKASYGEDGQLSSNQAKRTISSFLSLPLSVEIMGSYEAFMLYMDALERNIRSMDVNAIQFTSQQAGQEELSGIFNFSLLIDVYYLK